MPDPAHMEDFFACTIVVPTTVEIDRAKTLVFEWYDCRERRPVHDQFTKKASSGFPFDDLRLYVARRPRVNGRHPDLDGIVFEVQIKTILQHAWSVATHDLIYKTDTVSWPLERIAYQVKAMLEHAEVSVAEAATLSRSPGINKADQRTKEILVVIDNLHSFWTHDQLPRDIRRLATNILGLVHACGVGVDNLPEVVNEEAGRVGGIPRDLSPYAFIVQALARSGSVDFRRILETPQLEPVVVIHDGMDIPEWMRGDHPRILDLSAAAGPV